MLVCDDEGTTSPHHPDVLDHGGSEVRRFRPEPRLWCGLTPAPGLVRAQTSERDRRQVAANVTPRPEN